MKHFLAVLSVLGCMFFSVSCSTDELSDFEKNDPEAEFALFTMLDDYPALRSAFQSIDAYRFNDLLCSTMNDMPGDVKSVLGVVDDLLVNKKTDAMSSLRRILYRVLYQSDLDRDPVVKTKDPGYATKDFPYYDMVGDYVDPETSEKINLTKPILSMARKMFGYLKDKYNDEEIEEIIESLVTHLRDNDANVMKMLFEVMGNMYFQGNDNIWYDEEGKTCSREDIGLGTDTGIGNATRGSDASFSGQEAEMNDPVFKDAYYDFYREVGNLMSSSVSANGEEKRFSVVFKELICNIEKYFTSGGEKYDANDGNSNYHRGSLDAGGNMVCEVNPATGKKEYVNAEFGNTVKEIFSVLQTLFKRSDRPYSISDDDGDDDYFATRWVRILKQLKFDPESAHLEERMYDMFRYDVWGRDRLAEPTGDIATDAFSTNYLQQLLFLVAVSENFGWSDRKLTTGINYGHGPKEHAGYFTLNDAFYAFDTNQVMGLMNLYELALKGTADEANHLFRCINSFTRTEKMDFKFSYDTEYGALGFLPAQIAGDGGVPWGGNPDGGDGAILNNYRSYCVDGTGEPDIISIFMSMLARTIWEGEGPYYSKEEMEINGSEYTYRRPDGRVYVKVTKPDPDDASTWTYVYPYEGNKDVEDGSNPGERINNLYSDRVYTDYFMMHLENIKYRYPNNSTGNNVNLYFTPNEAGGIYGDADDAVVKDTAAAADFPAQRMCFEELIPENSVERECETHLEALYRNVQFFCTEKKIGMVIPLYIKVGFMDIMCALFNLNSAAFNAAFPGMNAAMIQAGAYIAAECNGAAGLGAVRKVQVSSSEMGGRTHTANMWKYKRNASGKITGGQSGIPGDYRIGVYMASDDLMMQLAYLVNAFSGTIFDLIVAIGFWNAVPYADKMDSLMDMMCNGMLGGGATLGSIFSTCIPSFGRMVFPRSVDPANPENWIEVIGSRKGELLKDENGVVHPEWGFVADDSDPNWKTRNSFFIELFMPFVIALRDGASPAISKADFFFAGSAEEDPGKGYVNRQAPANTKSPIKAMFDMLVASIMSPLMYYQDGADGAYPKKSWLPRLVGNHSPFTATSKVPGSTSPHSWTERAYYQPANVVNLIDVLSDSDRYGDYNASTKMCDGIVPLFAEYDVSRDAGPDNPPNTRLLTSIMKMIMAFGDDKFDETPAGKSYERSDYTTWSPREKMRYSAEQFITSFKFSKSDKIKNYENLKAKKEFWPEIFVTPDWMYSNDGIRPGDINLDKILDEWIGADETGKGLAVIPDSRPNSEDWDNFYKLFDAFGELMSNNGETEGKYNIVEDLIELIELLNIPDATDDQLKGLRHTVGSVFTRYDSSTGQWEYPDDLVHVVCDVMPVILETFEGRYGSLCNLVEVMMVEEGFLEYVIHSLDSKYAGRQIFEELYAFLGEDFIARPDSAFWNEFAELLTAFSDIINAEDSMGRNVKNHKAIMSAEPFEGLGELLSW